ncbi:hypothetical protein [Microbulbifer hydrolyticus]|uniref:Uncharacterized protein n=1 Tax=Microbulbifer hydrolyticus TaxID=48074 RepID=A0A6P1TEE6_9GAMM|nr:hypothetical protein [Microbulbifer hydrolyticus]MBB5212377.1 hypothetical protein [Microbulbifer hydrolyticus]QHQ40016.1 hypothetical protein GTQ55_14175 [Microbulbifer hydrolyticus]
MTRNTHAKLFVFPLLLLSLVHSPAFAQDEESNNGKKVDKEVKELSGISIIGNKEAPKSLYIVPWKSSEVGVESGLNSSLLDPSLQPLDKEVFERELEFYELSLPGED